MNKCACGRELHYANHGVRALIEKLVEDGSWRVPRHYIALHGLNAAELPELAQSLGFHKAGPIP